MPFFLPSSVTQKNILQVEKDGLVNPADLNMIDCSALQDFDSTALTLLLSWQKTMQPKGVRISIVNAPEKLKVLASVYGVTALLGLT
jgi:phospholipid transport system transporter-binding protein|uniref:STAS domain-containing protein n=1 Tax=Polynucleobacter sp. TaxID=2029855 RepID=UPI004047A084